MIFVSVFNALCVCVSRLSAVIIEQPVKLVRISRWEKMTSEELLWNRYKHDVELYRTYLDLVIKINVFYYAVTGAIISFYFLHIEKEPLVKYSLIFPFLMSLALAIFFWRSAGAAKPSQQEIQRLSTALGFEVYSVVPTVLSFLLMVFFWLFVIVDMGLITLFFKDVNFCAAFKLK